MKPKPKSKPQPASKAKPVAVVKPKAKVLQHPSSPPKRSTTSTTASATPPKKFEKKVAPEWNQVHGLTNPAVDFPDLVERRQTLARKIKEFELKIKGDKKRPETVEESYDYRIKALMDKSGVESVRIDADEDGEAERLVTVATGHTAERVDEDALRAKLLEYLDVEQIEEIMEAVMVGGDAYTYLLVTDPKKEEE